MKNDELENKDAEQEKKNAPVELNDDDLTDISGGISDSSYGYAGGICEYAGQTNISSTPLWYPHYDESGQP